MPSRDYLESDQVLNYDVFFKLGPINPKAGVVSLVINKNENSGKPSVNYKLLFKTTGIFDKIYKMRDTIECQFSSDMILLSKEKRSNSANPFYAIDQLDYSDINDSSASDFASFQPHIDTVMVSINDNLFDLLASALFLRSINWNNLEEGFEIPCAIALGEDKVPVKFRYDGQEIIEPNEDLKYKTRYFWINLMDDQLVESTAAAEVWVGDDKNHIPIKARVKLEIGEAEIYYNSGEGLRYPLSSVIRE